MKIQALYDLQQEINRLFIAGSKFSQDDPRLLKLVPVFEKMGEKAPVFKKIAGDIDELTRTNAQESASKLMAISTLLYAVLYTQGEDIVANQKQEAQSPSFDIQEIQTSNSYLTLKPIITALTQSNSGRLEILEDAYKRNIFRDFRLMPYLDQALGDKYSELADYIAEPIASQAGKMLIPFLLTSFKYEDKTENVRRLRILDKLHYTDIQDIIDNIFSNNLPNLQEEAINILAKNPNNEQFIIQLADDKNKQVREAAYKALSNYNSETSLKKLVNAFKNLKNNKSLNALVSALSRSSMPYFFKEVNDHFNEKLENFIQLDPAAEEKIVLDKLEEIAVGFELFANKDRKEVYELFDKFLLSETINNRIQSKKSIFNEPAQDVAYSISYVLNSFDKVNRLHYLEQIVPKMAKDNWQVPIFRNYFYAAFANNLSSDKIFNLFKTAYAKGFIDESDLFNIVYPQTGYLVPEETAPRPPQQVLSKQWIPVLYERLREMKNWNENLTRLFQLIHITEQNNTSELNVFLRERIQKETLRKAENLFQLVMDREVSDRFELIFNALANHNTSYYYSTITNADYWNLFPKEYAEKIRTMNLTKKITIFNEIADKIDAL